MKFKALKIGELEARLPIIQGGMGIGVSRSKLAAAVTNAGGIGVLSGAQIGYDEADFNRQPFKANLRALRKHIQGAKSQIKEGILGINFMVAQKYYDDYVKEAIESGIDLIISGAGLPLHLPKLVQETSVKIAPIVSSARALKLILKNWDRKYGRTADLVVVEGPKAGGHLGFSASEVEAGVIFEQIIEEVIEVVKSYEVRYHKIPVVVAGGIYSGGDIGRMLRLGADGVQMSTRFIGTKECDAHPLYKQKFIEATESDIVLIKSPVGLPGRAIRNEFVRQLEISGKIDHGACLQCLAACQPKDIPFCISSALIQAVTGHVEEGLLFAGENAYRMEEITTVQALMEGLEKELLEA